MSVDMAEPEEPDDDERLTDDDTPVEEVPPEEKRGPGRPPGVSKKETERLSEQIWEEYAGGMSQQAIADLHGMTRKAVSMRILRYRARQGIEEVQEAKSLDLGRYEAIIERVWTKTFQDPSPENVRSLAMLLDQRAKLLGLNAPKKLQVDGQMEMAPSPAFLTHLDRLVQQRERLTGTTERMIEAPDENVVEAEIIDDPD